MLFFGKNITFIKITTLNLTKYIKYFQNNIYESYHACYA